MISLNKEKNLVDDYVVFDLETTGFDPKIAKIIEIGALKYKNNELVEELSILVNPGCSIPDVITMITGIDDDLVEAVLAEQEFDPFQNALKLAKKKRIGPFRALEMRSEFRQKDMAVLARAGFDYDVVKKVMDFDPEE